MLELTLPSESVIVALILPLHAVLVVAYVCSSSDPASPQLFNLSFRIHEWPHPVVVKRVRLYQVDDVKSIRFASFGITDSEVVPLSVPPSVIVWLQN